MSKRTLPMRLLAMKNEMLSTQSFGSLMRQTWVQVLQEQEMKTEMGLTL